MTFYDDIVTFAQNLQDAIESIEETRVNLSDVLEAFTDDDTGKVEVDDTTFQFWVLPVSDIIQLIPQVLDELKKLRALLEEQITRSLDYQKKEEQSFEDVSPY